MGFKEREIFWLRLGQNIGNGNKERAVASYRVCRNLGLCISVIGSIILFPLREGALSLLTNDSQTLAIGMEYMICVLALQPMMAMFQSYLSLFNGAGKTGYSFIMSTVRLWGLRLPFIMICQHFTDLGRVAIWWAMIFSNLVIVLIGMWFYKKMDFSAGIASREQKKIQTVEAVS